MVMVVHIYGPGSLSATRDPALSEEALIGRSTDGQGLFPYPQVHAVCPCCDRAGRRVLRNA